MLHVPPEVASDNARVDPTQTPPEPADIDDGNGLTVNTVVVEQPVVNVYVITVVPGATPVTTPVVEPTVAIPGVPLLHVPLPELVNVRVKPTHTLAVPLIAPGFEFTVTTVVA